MCVHEELSVAPIPKLLQCFWLLFRTESTTSLVTSEVERRCQERQCCQVRCAGGTGSPALLPRSVHGYSGFLYPDPFVPVGKNERTFELFVGGAVWLQSKPHRSLAFWCPSRLLQRSVCRDRRPERLGLGSVKAGRVKRMKVERVPPGCSSPQSSRPIPRAQFQPGPCSSCGLQSQWHIPYRKPWMLG